MLKFDFTIPGPGDRGMNSRANHRSSSGLSAAATSQRGILQEESHQSIPERQRSERAPEKPLLVMKFGGTSVEDASCIERVVEIIRAASRGNQVVVVVSAMSGATNRLLEAASHAQSGNRMAVATILEELRKQHVAAARVLIGSAEQRSRLDEKIRDIFREGDHHCQGAIILRELTLEARDSISGLGERISAPLVAYALAERG